VAAYARHHRTRRAAVAGSDRHGHRLRLLVHGHAADRRGARHPLLRPHPRRRRLHRPARRHGLLRAGTGRGQCPGRRRSRPGIRGVEASGAKVGGCRLSGCRRG
jgi:hypothetical protein